ncbi:TPA: DNA repair protein [Yersinia enterocolitica]|uniref:TrlF family AAA-like ATPase n=1 Tax=Yersinia bercovieri TaxID=634 RepID=UPI0011A6993A|nr:DNA repair protein [Yersinia bercovieri]HEA9924686.1 DNA repair protein [Yersinia enterocolitica]
MKGSEWNKWDLHIHSPMTWLANLYPKVSDIEGYVRKLGEENIALVAVTNYFYFQQNELEIIRDEITRQRLNITVLGNIEFRLDQQNRKGEWINIHCLFSEKISTQKINEVLARLPLRTTNAGKAVYCSERSVNENEKTIDHITVDRTQLIEHLKREFTEFTDYIIAVCPNGYGGFRPGAEGRSTDVATEIDRLGHIMFANNPGDRAYFLSTERYDGARIKPVFRCSDAHSLGQIGTLFSWVKASPTFEGFRQALLEPEARIQIDDKWPTVRIPKVHFSRIDVEGTIFDGQEICFKKLSIPLNPDMVAVIGGRGTGKSLLLDAVRSRFAGVISGGSEERPVNVQYLTIELDKATGEKVVFDARSQGYDYLHVSQGEIKTLCQQPGRISDEIKKMLRLQTEDIPELVGGQLAGNIGAYRAFRDYYNFRDEHQQLINTPEYQNGIITVAQEKIHTLTSDKNKALIEQFQANSTRVTNLTQGLRTVKTLVEEIEGAEKSINARILEVNTVNAGGTEIPSLNLSILKASVIQNVISIEKNVVQLSEENVQIVATFRAQGIEQDVSGLLEKIGEYQAKIEHATLRRGEIEKRVAQFYEGITHRYALTYEFVTRLLEKKVAIDATFASLPDKPHFIPPQQELIKEILTDIRIYGSPHFETTEFYSSMLACLNGGKFRSSGEQSSEQKLRDVFGVETIDDFKELISGKEKISIPESPGKKITIDDFLWKTDYFNSQGPFALLNFLFSPEQITRYLTVRAEFEYKGKTVEKLSAGQRGTFYVCLKLATDTFGSPFVFDQPEDDLDNDFIMHNLVPLFRKIKQYRQVIIVTHNANLVVNCDAEQVIIASNIDEVISYRCGALEDGEQAHGNSMRKAICDVLEGGLHAFEAREQKYGMIQH